MNDISKQAIQTVGYLLALWIVAVSGSLIKLLVDVSALKEARTYAVHKRGETQPAAFGFRVPNLVEELNDKNQEKVNGDKTSRELKNDMGKHHSSFGGPVRPKSE